MTGRVVHFEVPFDDAERATAFYREIFGWNTMPMPEMDYTIVSTGPTGDQGPTEPGYIGGGMTKRGGSNSGTVIVIDVGDIDKALAAVEANGGSTVTSRTPVGEMGWSAYFTDSEGNVVGLWETKTT